jgi:hypothetical protein
MFLAVVIDYVKEQYIFFIVPSKSAFFQIKTLFSLFLNTHKMMAITSNDLT